MIYTMKIAGPKKRKYMKYESKKKLHWILKISIET